MQEDQKGRDSNFRLSDDDLLNGEMMLGDELHEQQGACGQRIQGRDTLGPRIPACAMLREKQPWRPGSFVDVEVRYGQVR